MPDNIKRAVVLMNLGSPDSTNVKDVGTYLKEFLMDKRVLDTPYLLRSLLVNGIIVPFRSPKSAHAYKSVWTKEGSPLIVLTRQLQKLVQAQMQEPVEIAMRYGNPGMKEAYDNILAKQPDTEEVILLPLYPHYAMSSYETAVVHAEDTYTKGKYPFKITTIKPFYNETNYIDALRDSIASYLNEDYDQVLFSFHGIPERHLLKSDPTHSHCLKVADCCNVPSTAHATCYRHQCYQTANLVAASLGIPKNKYAISFQSRLGRSEWIKPYTAARLTELPGEGVKKLLVVCPAFVSDCLETLEEIAMQGKESFISSGGTSLTLIPCLNIHPLWVKTIASWITQFRENNLQMALTK
ncbi:MAG: ferrochelatase [Flavipsychrobacter sp.]|nr:ferrochelatase [Flavipsychrobacter sp.]